MLDNESYTVARVCNGVNCVELHYIDGKSTIEYGTRTSNDSWENKIENIDWFDKNMSISDLENKLENLFDVEFGGKDNVSKNCDEIHIKAQENKDKFITIKLDDYLSIDNTIKYYEEKIKPILNISENYDVDFTEKIPFECFGSDADSYTNSSFTDYYREILKNRNINIDSICTNDWSDGKYNLIVNGNDFKITAWDSLKDVIDNIDSIEKTLEEKEMQAEV